MTKYIFCVSVLGDEMENKSISSIFEAKKPSERKFGLFFSLK